MSDKQPNILLITTDQQRYDTSGPRAPSFMRTPHFDHLCREGVTFRSGFADCPICVAARAAIMTGKTVTTHGMAYNGHTSEFFGRDGTLPTVLRGAGYQTAAIGKMHFSPQRARHGFDEMILPDDYYREMRERGHECQPMRHGLGQNELYPGLATVPEAMTLTSWIAEQCVLYIRERRDPSVPFLLWCSFSKPHPPFDPPEPYYSMYRDCPIPEPVYGDWCDGDACPEAVRRCRERYAADLLPPEILREARAAYYGLITQIDYNMGRVFAALQDLDLFRDTMILYTSDHGEYLGDHRLARKIFFHEPSAHVPFMMRLPKSVENRPHGVTIDEPVILADILPTVAAVAGAELPSGVDGVDLVGLARGATAGSRPFVEFMAGVNADAPYASIGITDGRWKYLWYPEGGSEQLFDLKTDPLEQKDLARRDEHRAKASELREELARRHSGRTFGFAKAGKLVTTPLQGDTLEDRRDLDWPGYHTDRYAVDVRH